MELVEPMSKTVTNGCQQSHFRGLCGMISRAHAFGTMLSGYQ